MCGLHDDALRKIHTCWKCYVLTVKLHIEIVYLVGYNKLLHILFSGRIHSIHTRTHARTRTHKHTRARILYTDIVGVIRIFH